MIVKILTLSVMLASSVAWSLPKYGPNAVPISKDPNREYFRKNPAPDFWSLISYYIPQPNDTSCSAVSFAMLLNASRDTEKLTTQDELVTYDSLLEKYTDERYRDVMKADLASVAKHKFSHADVSNQRLSEVLTEALKKLALWSDSSKVEVVRIDEMGQEKAKKHFHETLVKNEKSAEDFIVLSFVQGILTGDPEGMAAHIAVVGAYDQSKKKVLVLDPDRKWYGPYWSPEDKVFEALADKRSDDKHPGWIYVKVR